MPDFAQAAAEVLCSKCHRNPRAADNGTNPWCKECRADYQRAYEAGRSERLKDTGYAKGVEAMRKGLLEKLGALHPDGMTKFGEMSRWIREFPTPRPQA